jgi:hypothetical protein
MKRFLAAALVPGLVACYGAWCILSGQALVPATRVQGFKRVSGTDAVTGGVCYILLAAWIYVYLDWRDRERLRWLRVPVLVALWIAYTGAILLR